MMLIWNITLKSIDENKICDIKATTQPTGKPFVREKWWIFWLVTNNLPDEIIPFKGFKSALTSLLAKCSQNGFELRIALLDSDNSLNYLRKRIQLFNSRTPKSGVICASFSYGLTWDSIISRKNEEKPQSNM